MLVESICVRTQVPKYEYTFALKLSGSAWWRIRHQLHQSSGTLAAFPKQRRRLTPVSQRLVGRQSESRDQTSDTQTSALSHQLIDLDRTSDDHCIFASLPLSCTSASSCCPALWAEKLMASVKCVVPIAALGSISLGDSTPGFLF